MKDLWWYLHDPTSKYRPPAVRTILLSILSKGWGSLRWQVCHFRSLQFASRSTRIGTHLLGTSTPHSQQALNGLESLLVIKHPTTPSFVVSSTTAVTIVADHCTVIIESMKCWPWALTCWFVLYTEFVADDGARAQYYLYSNCCLLRDDGFEFSDLRRTIQGASHWEWKGHIRRWQDSPFSKEYSANTNATTTKSKSLCSPFLDGHFGIEK